MAIIDRDSTRESTSCVLHAVGIGIALMAATCPTSRETQGALDAAALAHDHATQVSNGHLSGDVAGELADLARRIRAAGDGLQDRLRAAGLYRAAQLVRGHIPGN